MMNNNYYCARALYSSPSPSSIPHLLRAIQIKRRGLVLLPLPVPLLETSQRRTRRYASSSSSSSAAAASDLTAASVRSKKRNPTTRSSPSLPPSSSSSSSYPASAAAAAAAKTPHARGPERKGEATAYATQQQPSFRRERRKVSGYLVGVSIFGFSLALYLSYAYTSYRRAMVASRQLGETLAQNADVSDRWDDLGRDYDDEVDWSEKVMLMGRKRARLCREAGGKVLEVSCGTGRNTAYYDLSPGAAEPGEGVEALVFNDQSRVMLNVAEKRFDDMQKAKKEKDRFTGKVEWVVGDAGIKGVVKRPEGGFDTVVQTMGLCSVHDPVLLLRTLGALVRQPGEQRKGVVKKNDGTPTTNTTTTTTNTPAVRAKAEDFGDDELGGKILLLEHGRGSNSWVNSFLDDGAPMHADRYGCWWNKDIGQIVKESGLKVESIRRYHFGTTWEVILRPNPKL